MVSPPISTRPHPDDIVVTGLGAVSPLGVTPAEVHRAVCEGRHAFGPARGAPHRLAACLPGRPHASTLAVQAARQATRHRAHTHDVWVVCGTTASNLASVEASWWDYAAELRPSPDLPPQLAHAPARAVQDALGSTAPTHSVSSACTSGALAIQHAADLLRSGRAHAAVAVGVDVVCALTLEGFAALKLLAPGVCRPMDASDKGLLLGDGAGAVFLERRRTAEMHGHPICAVLLAAAATSHGRSLSAPHPEGLGLRRAIRAALRAQPPPHLVVAHATGTAANDAAEALALAAELPGVPVTATKGALGHTLGAAAMLDSVLAIHVLRAQVAPPVVGLRTPAAPLDLIQRARPMAVRSVLTLSAAFGGGCAALLWGRHAPAAETMP